MTLKFLATAVIIFTFSFFSNKLIDNSNIDFAKVPVTSSLHIFSAKADGTYQADPAHTYIGFAVKHFVYNTVRGSFPKIAGSMEVRNNKITSAEIRIQVSSITTNHEKRDTHLKSADFFDVEKYPEITYKTNKIDESKKGLVATGDLTMHGVTKEVKINFSMSKPFKDPLTSRGQMCIVITGKCYFDRRDFGINWSRLMDSGGLFVSNEVEIEINSEFFLPKAK